MFVNLTETLGNNLRNGSGMVNQLSRVYITKCLSQFFFHPRKGISDYEDQITMTFLLHITIKVALNTPINYKFPAEPIKLLII